MCNSKGHLFISKCHMSTSPLRTCGTMLCAFVHVWWMKIMLLDHLKRSGEVSWQIGVRRYMGL